MNDKWKTLAEKLGIKNVDIEFYGGNAQNPAESVLTDLQFRGGSTVGSLYDHLIDLDLQLIADYL